MLTYDIIDTLGNSDDIISNVPEDEVDSTILAFIPDLEFIPGALDLVHNWKEKSQELLAYTGVKIV